MSFTNLIIRKPNLSKGITKSFGTGIDFSEEVKNSSFRITQDNFEVKLQDNEKVVEGNFIEKAHVKQHERKTKSGKLISVREHDDKRIKHTVSSLRKMKNVLRRLRIRDKNFYFDPETEQIKHSHYSDKTVQRKINEILKMDQDAKQRNKDKKYGIDIDKLSDMVKKQKIKHDYVSSSVIKIPRNFQNENDEKHFPNVNLNVKKLVNEKKLQLHFINNNVKRTFNNIKITGFRSKGENGEITFENSEAYYTVRY